MYELASAKEAAGLRISRMEELGSNSTTGAAGVYIRAQGRQLWTMVGAAVIAGRIHYACQLLRSSHSVMACVTGVDDDIAGP